MRGSAMFALVFEELGFRSANDYSHTHTAAARCLERQRPRLQIGSELISTCSSHWDSTPSVGSAAMLRGARLEATGKVKSPPCASVMRATAAGARAGACTGSASGGADAGADTGAGADVEAGDASLALAVHMTELGAVGAAAGAAAGAGAAGGAAESENSGGRLHHH